MYSFFKLNVFLQLSVILAASIAAGPVQADPRLGRAIVMGVDGSARYRNPDGEGKLEVGDALTHGHSIQTGRDSKACVALTPGAILCIDAQTRIEVQRLEMLTDGLPAPDKPMRRHITLGMGSGALLVKAGEIDPNLALRIDLPKYGALLAQGGRFLIVFDGTDRYVSVEQGRVVHEHGDSRTGIASGEAVKITRNADDGQVQVTQISVPEDDFGHDFKICRQFSRSFDDLILDHRARIRTGAPGLRGTVGQIRYIGTPDVWFDVSPSRRVPGTRASEVTPTQPPASGGQRDKEWVWDWYRNVAGTLRGFNYVPRTAVNPIEMWMAETFDADTIREELEWAEESGHNAARVFLPYLVWKNDADGLLKRMDLFLDIASSNGISTTFVLFDDVNPSGEEPTYGKQPDPIPGIYNSRWTPSPGHALVRDSSQWADLERYVRSVVGEFRTDKRVLMWDIYSKPGADGLRNRSIPLVRKAIEWARSENPRQPITVGIWYGIDYSTPKEVVELVDTITIHSFNDAQTLQAQLLWAQTYGRPVIATEWLKRNEGNTFQKVLPVLARHRVGWYHWGLVKGRSQLYLPQSSRSGDAEPELWEHDLLYEDGEPFSDEELELIRSFRFTDNDGEGELK